MKLNIKTVELKSDTDRVCKKCGTPLASTSKYKYCDNCRREQAKVRKNTCEAFLGLGLAVLAVVPGVKHFVKK